MVSLLPNSPHLDMSPALFKSLSSPTEADNAVALGKTRTKQYSLLKNHLNDCHLDDKAMCVPLQGDAFVFRLRCRH
ncbi:hypothetical protein BDP27DRAFT_607379 [Rhodocollybia butyracea]|uniref:Uncharacterized protein n=1 Tax=Rhodocollybia butyracea TaxID=206335 RepID=A0A9P5Q9H5_9AGAR|nr:hypothetical protein BDP27DRAFT_607379 [Rhodocollybia butyracea]